MRNVRRFTKNSRPLRRDFEWHVRRIERSNIIIDLGRTEAIIPHKEQVPTERFRVKDRIQGFVLEVKRSSRGPTNCHVACASRILVPC